MVLLTAKSPRGDYFLNLNAAKQEKQSEHVNLVPKKKTIS